MSEAVSELEPYYEESQSIYDVSDEFFALFLGPTMGYTCSYFERDDMSLDEAQIAKFDLALGKLDLQPGMTLLDVGCGWGGALRRAVEQFDVNVIGITLSRNQYEYSSALMSSSAHYPHSRGAVAGLGGVRRTGRPDRVHRRVRGVQGRAIPGLLPEGIRHPSVRRRMLLHTILAHPQKYFRDNGIKVTISDLKFMRFIGTEIFPGGQLPAVEDIESLAAGSGFTLERLQLLQPHYARTLDMWAENLAANKEQAIAITSEEVYDRYMKYLTGCADFFRRGISTSVSSPWSRPDGPRRRQAASSPP